MKFAAWLLLLSGAGTIPGSFIGFHSKPHLIAVAITIGIVPCIFGTLLYLVVKDNEERVRVLQLKKVRY